MIAEKNKRKIKRCLITPYLFFDLSKRDLVKTPQKIYKIEFHLKKAIDWLIRAQKVSDDGGVSACYSLFFGWKSSYPETSGYIICTLLDYYDITKNKIYLDVSKKITDWECSIQLDNGAFQGNVFKEQKGPVIFNTGQVLLGLVRSYKTFKSEKYKEAAIKAGEFLVLNQEQDGNWIKHVFNNIPHTYNVRVAWALLELFIISKNEKYKEAAIKNLNWAKTQQNSNYWFNNNSFTLNRPPLLHTIVYAISGFLEASILLKDDDLFKIALNPSLKLLNYYVENNYLLATYDKNWQSKDFYICVTGIAQLSIIWLKLYLINRDKKFLINALKLNNYLKSKQIINSRFKDIEGAIKGSDPIWGFYNPFGFPNWATKFYCDALMLELEILSLKKSRNKDYNLNPPFK